MGTDLEKGWKVAVFFSLFGSLQNPILVFKSPYKVLTWHQLGSLGTLPWEIRVAFPEEKPAMARTFYS